MTRIDFFSGAQDKLRTACQLSHQAMRDGMRVLLHVPDDEMADKLDRLLWHYPPIAFMPHCHSHEAAAASMPVVIARDERFPHYQLLISLHAECPSFFSRFERVFEIVGQDEAETRTGRIRYKFYKDRGYELRHTDLARLRA